MRKQADYCQFGADLAQGYIDSYDQLNKAGDKADTKSLVHMHLATLLTDTAKFSQAIEVCQQALSHKLTDGTVTGFEGRINRIEKAQAKAGA
ncbi:hypothetical protein G3R49_16760 [Shewanella sp. WXL01]|uniref:Tetratricopeptide repeat protein n=2 Tax=Shewanella maritima TaxID=2520507 RepID=A0A411PJ67_9GAMM|nr:hypothetical protein [Shewanella sp. WXL01]QBF83472.1 hypothetical protein EXU30_12775 [Shewanella maritima]